MYRTLVQMFKERVEANPLFTVQLVKDDRAVFHPVTYIQLYEKVKATAAMLSSMGLKRGDVVTLISDNRAEWMNLDLAILALGASDAPRGRDAMDYEIEYIATVTESRFVVLENTELVRRFLSYAEKTACEHIILIDNTKAPLREEEYVKAEEKKIKITLFSRMLEEGLDVLKDKNEQIEHEILLGSEDDVATIIFTSGTTGMPKGVVITHGAILYQLERIREIKDDIAPQSRWLAVLPVWHSFERLVQYVILYYSDIIAYSKPIGKIMLTDMAHVKPQYICSVPRIWETVKAGVYQSLKNKKKIEKKLFAFFLKCGEIRMAFKERFDSCIPDYKKRSRIFDKLVSIIPLIIFTPLQKIGKRLVFSQITSKLGGAFIAGISGGGSMNRDVQNFFKAMDVKVIDGYGLTETSPLVAAQHEKKTKRGVLTALSGTEVKVVNEDGKEVERGEKGVLLVRGPQVMKGYYKRDDLTKAVIDKDGWFNTGDLARMTRSGDFAIVGRAKDTIVLSGGENIEPVPIESALNQSEYIESAVAVGQDKKYLAALIVIDQKNVERYLKDNHIPYVNRENLSDMEEVKALINSEVFNIVSTKNGFKSFEQIKRTALLSKSFAVGDELSAKQELKRFVIADKYREEIEKLFSQADA